MEERTASALPQRAYIWQRDWNAPVTAAINRSKDALAGFIVLAAEIEWRNKQPHPVKPRVDWTALHSCGKSVGLAMRIAPNGGPFEDDDATTRFLCATARNLIASAKTAQAGPVEFQLDFDCAQKKLPGYAKWVRAIRDSIRPVPLVITALPAWLDEPEFQDLARAAVRYVLQVHSLPRSQNETAPMICDPALARKWAARAEKIGLPFEIALPTYRYQAGYDAAGKFIGIESDSVRPNWPPGTRVKEFATDAAAMADLVGEWKARPPRHCTGLIWYRLPVGSDHNNWPSATMRAVMDGRAPRSSFSVRVNRGLVPQEPLQLADLSLFNDGETDDAPRGEVVITWPPAAHAISGALPGWELHLEAARARFVPRNDAGARLPPGAVRAIGWLRLEPAVPIHVEIIY